MVSPELGVVSAVHKVDGAVSCPGAGSARRDIIFDEGLDAWPGIFTLQEFQCTVLPKMPSEGVVMFVPEYPQMKVV